MQYWSLTDPGVARTQNQDTCQIESLDRNTLLCVVCDGMGGAKSGNVASSLAVDVFVQEVKRSWKSDMKQDELDQVHVMLGTDANLSTAYFLKELLYRILDETDPDVQKREFGDWIEAALDSDIKSFVRCAARYQRWFKPIVNSFYCAYTNAFTEGFNNKIRWLIKQACCFRDREYFKLKIYQQPEISSEKSILVSVINRRRGKIYLIADT